ncbi:hypothetical protein HDV57DRAFT_294697 [Trichoderma longibrachiatum]
MDVLAFHPLAAAIPAQHVTGPQEEGCPGSLHDSTWDEHRWEATLDALVTAGSCGQMSVAGLLPYLRMEGGWTTPSGARGTIPCLAMAAAASWPLTHSCPSISMARHGTARHGQSGMLRCCLVGQKKQGSMASSWTTSSSLSPEARRHCLSGFPFFV